MLLCTLSMGISRDGDFKTKEMVNVPKIKDLRKDCEYLGVDIPKEAMTFEEKYNRLVKIKQKAISS